MYRAKVIADSINPDGQRITTMELEYWRAIHGELMTHRMFSRNASSSRAIPVAKLIEQVRENPAMPIHWGKNRPGMQAHVECDSPITMTTTPEQVRTFTKEEAWRWAAWNAAHVADGMSKAGYHKQVVNRLLEPFQWMRTIVTATEWDNFFDLRCHPDAQPEMQHLANLMRFSMENSTPVLREYEDWHLPYVSNEERLQYPIEVLAKCSTARCARVSYLNHDGSTPDIDKDALLHDRLLASVPIHASPAEHPAQAIPGDHRNFRGWMGYRCHVESGLGAPALTLG